MQVTFGKHTKPLSAVLENPDGEGPFPAVVVIHEVFGLTDGIRQVAKDFSERGYVSLAVDLIGESNRSLCMFKLMGQMIAKPLDNGSLDDLRAAMDYLGGLPQVDPDRMGVIGFCLGGGFAISWASTDPRVKAVAPFYAMNPRPLSAVARVCPLVGSYPEKDFTTRPAKKLEKELSLHQVEHDIKIYPATKHSFFNSPRNSTEEEARADAWARTLAFFDERLKVLH